MPNNKRPVSHGPGPRGSGEKAKDFKKSIAHLLKYSNKYYSLIITAFVLAIISSVLAVLGPNKLKEFVNVISDGFFSGIDFDKIWTIALTLAGIYLVSSICMAIQNIFMTKVSQNVSYELRRDISKKINNVPIKFIDTSSHGDLLSRITNDVDTISQGMSNSMGTLVHSTALIATLLIMMFVTNYILAFTAIACSMLGFVVIMIIMKTSQKYFNLQQENLGKIDGHIEEIYAGHNVVRMYNATAEESKKFEKLNEELFKSGHKSQFYGGLMMPLMIFIGSLSYVAVCVVGAILVLNNQTDVGTIVAFIMYARMFTNQLSQMAQSFAYVESTAASSERVFELLSQDELPDESKKSLKLPPKEVLGNVEFEDVCFGYNPNKQVINDFSMSVSSGQKVAIVGPTGAGKTTIVNLLMRFYELNSGTIKIDGINSIQLKRDNIHNLFGMVLQDTWLFTGTLKENLVFNKSNVTVDEINSVISACGLTHFVNTLPQGINTPIDSNTSISVGQKQLLTIARAMIQNSPMIILDEATSSVDTRTEIVIQKAMDELSKGRTSFVIAHRLSTIKNADVIIVMEHGSVVETGNHETLLAKNGAYARLYNSQFEE
jgi:ATP-binding cassette subfamily B protein